MIFQKLILNNFRQFEGKQEIKFSNNQNKHISIIFAANGVGKTTILSAIVWGLYGDKKLNYTEFETEFLNKNIFNSMNDGDISNVEVILSFEDNGHNYIIERKVKVKKEHNKQYNFDFESKILMDNKPISQNEINSILSPNLKEYFFFDGEGIDKLVDYRKPKLVETAIKNVMQIDDFEIGIKYLKNIKKEFDQELISLKEEKGIDNKLDRDKLELENRLDNNLQQLDKNKKEITKMEDELENIKIELLKVKEIKEKYSQKLKLEENLKSLIDNLKKLDYDYNKIVIDKGYLALSYSLFNEVDEFLEKKREKGELPLIGISKNYIEKLLQNKECICGEKIEEGDIHYQNLKNLLSKTTSKNEIEKKISNLSVLVESNKNLNIDIKSQLDEVMDNKDIILKSINNIEEELELLQSEIKEDISKKEDKLLDKEMELNEKKDNLLILNGSLNKDNEIIKKDLDKIIKQLSSIKEYQEDIQILNDRIILCEEAILIMEREKLNRTTTIRKEFSNVLTDRFDKFLHSSKKIRIDDKFHLIIEENGKTSAKSRGEAKLISLIFISTLVEKAKELELQKANDSLNIGAGIYPMVIDSPYGEFDEIYKQTISKLIKELAPQVILLLNQAQWNSDLETIFGDRLANVYRIIGYRPKLKNITNKNILKFYNKEYELEIYDTKEWSSIERIEL